MPNPDYGAAIDALRCELCAEREDRAFEAAHSLDSGPYIRASVARSRSCIAAIRLLRNAAKLRSEARAEALREFADEMRRVRTEYGGDYGGGLNSGYEFAADMAQAKADQERE
jgi:hypothetical protein